ELNRRVGAAIAKPWGVELAAGFSRVRVLASYARAMRRLSSLIGDQDPIVTRALIRSRGSRPLYQARIGADTRAAAHTLCARIRRAGGACLVLRTRH
ncbi:MAG: SPOR domain-containing protein, partial [Pseudolabrys sp.]